MHPTNRVPARDGKGRYIRTVESTERDANAARLRLAGVSYQRIADQLGYYDRHTARLAVERVLAATVREPGEQLRTLELERLDAALLEVHQVLRREHLTVSQGKVVTLDGKPLRDDGPVLQAVDRLLRIGERRAKLLGLDAVPEDVEGRMRREVTVRVAEQLHEVLSRVLDGLGLSDDQRALVPGLLQSAVVAFAGTEPREIEGEAV